MDKLVGRVYRIVCKTTNKQYIGSTIYPLKFRLQRHEKAFTGHVRRPAMLRGCTQSHRINHTTPQPLVLCFHPPG